MHWYEVAAWGALGGLVQGALFLGTGLVQLSREKPRKYRWRDVIDPPADALVTLTRVIFGAVACLLVNQASPPLSIPAAIIVGFAAPALLVYIGKPLAAIAAVDKGRESRISSEAERLATIRETSPELTAQGVSTDVADILAARREGLADQLRIVKPGYEGSDAS